MTKYVFLFLLSLSAFAQNTPQVDPVTPNDPVNNAEKAINSSKNVPVSGTNPYEIPKTSKEKLHYGGNFMLQGSSYGGLYFDISPMIGYEITKKGTVGGISATLMSLGSLAYGARLFVRQPVWKSIYLHGEYEMINATTGNFFNDITATNTRKWGGSPLIGAGFYQGGMFRGGNVAQNGYFLSILYNLGYPSNGFRNLMSANGLVFRVGYFF